MGSITAAGLQVNCCQIGHRCPPFPLSLKAVGRSGEGEVGAGEVVADMRFPVGVPSYPSFTSTVRLASWVPRGNHSMAEHASHSGRRVLGLGASPSPSP